MNFRIRTRIFTPEEKAFVKNKVLEVSSILKKWNAIIPDANISEIKNAFFQGKILVDSPDWLIDRNIINNFQKKVVPELGEPVELAVLRSFMGACKKYARNASKRVAAEIKIESSDVYEDLLQEAMRLVLHSMYYFSKDFQLSTFIIHSLKNGINRLVRYNYCPTSPISVEDNTIKVKILEILGKNPFRTLEEIVEEIKKDYEFDETKIHQLFKKVFRESNETNEGFNTKTSLANIPCKKDYYEEVDCLDTVNLLEKVFSTEGKILLNLTEKEIDILKFGVNSNFERGWQVRYSEISTSEGSPISRQRTGQIYDSAVKKIRPFLAKAFD